MNSNLSLDFIAGLVCGEGCFSWFIQNGKQRVAAFSLKMHYKDKDLVMAVRDSLGLKEPVHEYNHQGRHYVMLVVRKRKIIEDVIIPAFEGKLSGSKKNQFEHWKKRFYQGKTNWKYIKL
jgi:hypothetical protein